MCTCRSLNRNNNASSDGDDDETSGNNQSRPQLYSHMRKVYDRDTALLEHVYITMSTARPQHCIHDVRLESITQRRRRPTRVSKQRAKVLITEYCSRKTLRSINELVDDGVPCCRVQLRSCLRPINGIHSSCPKRTRARRRFALL